MARLENKLIVLSDGNSIEDLPPSVHYLSALDPRVVTPRTFKAGGMTHIAFRDPEETVAVNIYRTISLYIDHGISVQDEIHPHHENTGVQFNFEFDQEGRLCKYSGSQQFSPLMKRCVDEILILAARPGSSVWSRDGYMAISDGKSWIQESSRQSVTGTPIEIIYTPKLLPPE